MNAEKNDRDAIITEHHYLCVRGARKFLRDGVDRRDLEQVAAIGLIKATDRFDPALGTPFEAYAWMLVIGELMHYVRDTERVLRVPRRIRDLDRRSAAGERALTAALGRTPQLAELCAFTGATAQELGEVFRFREERVPLSMEGLRPYEQAELSYTIDRHVDNLAIEALLSGLTDLERQIVREIYENDTPVGELAKRLGYSRRHVTRLHRNALRKLAPAARPMSA